ncbi:unnamed protein product [Alternaria sp. RS040]
MDRKLVQKRHYVRLSPPSYLPVTAIRDALDLARALSRIAEDGLRGADLEAVMTKYKDTMLERGVRAVQLSQDAITKNNLVREGAPFAYGQYSKPIPLEKIRL